MESATGTPAWSLTVRAGLAGHLPSLLIMLTLAANTTAQLDADFTAMPVSGVNPLTASFTDTTSGGPPSAYTVGGISRTEQYKGYHFDMGGHRFFTKVQ
jgi:PKD repeat protein